MAAPIGNKFALGLTDSGRPPVYENDEQVKEKIEQYFQSLLNEEGTEYVTRPTMTGMALFLGFASRQSMYDYAKKEEFSYIITRAQQVIAMSYEEMLLTKVSSGAIFALKNMGWDDKQIIDQNNSYDGVEKAKVTFVSKRRNKNDNTPTE